MESPFWAEFALWAYALDRNEGLSCTSILESFARGHPVGRVWSEVPTCSKRRIHWVVNHFPSGWGHPFRVRLLAT